MIVTSKIIEGIFIEESKNRFICIVQVDGEIEECYVPSSARMEKYLKLEKKKVLLTENKNKGRTKYTLFAVQYYNKYIMLNLNQVNDCLEHYFINKNSNLKTYKEKILNGYKFDLIIKEESLVETTLIEAKGIIDIRKECYFPKVYTKRAISQLRKISELLLKGEKS